MLPIQDADLFADVSIADLSRTPIRPLGLVSDYVVERLPYELARSQEHKTPAALADEIDRILASVKLADVDIPLARVDLRMIQSAVIKSGGAPKENLLRLCEEISRLTRGPNIITYGDVVLNNPGTDPRTTTPDKIGYSEASFDRLHFRAEQYCEAITERLEQVIELLEARDVDKGCENLAAAIPYISDIIRIMKFFDRMSRDHFKVFRNNMSAHSGLKGASGYFSPGIALIDLYFAGAHLPDKQLDTIETDLSLGYYEKRDQLRKAMQRARGKNHAVGLADQINDKDLYRTAANFAAAVLNYRRAHHRTVALKLPEALTDSLSGTIGTTKPAELLQERREPYETLCAYLESKAS